MKRLAQKKKTTFWRNQKSETDSIIRRSIEINILAINNIIQNNYHKKQQFWIDIFTSLQINKSYKFLFVQVIILINVKSLATKIANSIETVFFYESCFLAHLSKARSELLWSPYVRRVSVVRRVSTFYLNDISS